MAKPKNPPIPRTITVKKGNLQKTLQAHMKKISRYTPKRPR